MNRSKVMFSGLVFSVVFGLMYWYRDLLGAIDGQFGAPLAVILVSNDV